MNLPDLSLAKARKPRGEHFGAAAEYDASRYFRALVTVALRNNRARARINQANLLVFAGGGKKASVPIPAHRLNGVVVARDHAYGLGLLQVPQDDLKVGTRAQHDILGGGMPLDLAHAPLMPVQVDDPVVEVVVQAVVAYLPHFDCGVLGARGDLVVVERIPLEVEDGPAVSAHFGHVDVDAARVLDGYDDESAAAALLRYHGHKLGIDRAEG